MFNIPSGDIYIYIDTIPKGAVARYRAVGLTGLTGLVGFSGLQGLVFAGLGVCSGKRV